MISKKNKKDFPQGIKDRETGNTSHTKQKYKMTVNAYKIYCYKT
jgi:hypothetical protein